MKNIVVYLRVSPYIRAWLASTLGDPVRFPAGSYENAVLHHVLRRRPLSSLPEAPGEDTIAVVIPDSAVHRPEYYNYLGRRGRRAVAECIEHLFRMHLWSDCRHLIGTRLLERGLDDWCRLHGIGIEHREAVRKKFYRMRRDYLSHGIILGKKYFKKDCHASGHFCPQILTPKKPKP